ncbi:hypothetical protein [Bacillus phage vB_BceM_Bc431v3]|uniref:Uncharacterized protein n=1 Tax=Bacillus phage vB_BceM_Bc431v3 TaxID=1195072 RepID=M4HN66_9CAUD|nr:hypothetical protein K201_gp075 [Bacillus phage vB_BceM_Bc431v3]AFQ96383.1 hypothetical protein [Bacillus phage vB_BceM_Bc431v3]
MVDNSKTIMIIKDCIFEIVMSGTGDIEHAANYLHNVSGFSKKDVLQAVNEMIEEANREED